MNYRHNKTAVQNTAGQNVSDGCQSAAQTFILLDFTFSSVRSQMKGAQLGKHTSSQRPGRKIIDRLMFHTQNKDEPTEYFYQMNENVADGIAFVSSQRAETAESTESTELGSPTDQDNMPAEISGDVCRIEDSPFRILKVRLREHRPMCAVLQNKVKREKTPRA